MILSVELLEKDNQFLHTKKGQYYTSQNQIGYNVEQLTQPRFEGTSVMHVYP